MPDGPRIEVIRAGDTTKTDPFTILIIANPYLEAPWNSGAFIVAPIIADRPAFEASASYIETALFGDLPDQKERFIADSRIATKIRMVSLFDASLPGKDENSLVGLDAVSDLLIARRLVIRSFLARCGAQADVA